MPQSLIKLLQLAMMTLLLLLILGAASPAKIIAQESNFVISTRAGNSLLIQSQLKPIVINRLHSWELLLLSADGHPLTDAEINLVGGMPEHDHGLPTQPQVTAQSDPGHYLVEGIRFHMPGKWKILFSIESGAGPDSATLEFSL